MEKKIIYCGDEFTTEYMLSVLKQLGFTEFEVFTIDGEYHIEVSL